jgi:hypothetical protein
MNRLIPVPRRADTARRRLTKQGVLWLTRRIGRHALRGEWQSALSAAMSRDRLLSTVADADPGIDAMRVAAAEARAVLAAVMGGRSDD